MLDTHAARTTTVCIADAEKDRRTFVEHALAEINESWEVLHCKTGDQVLKCQDNIDILFIHKHFDDGKTGSETIQRIRNQEVRGYRMLIVALWSEDADIDNPGADFFWDNTAVAPTKMVEVLKAFVSSPKEMLVTCAGSKQHDGREGKNGGREKSV